MLKTWTIKVDGASRENPGEAGCGVYMESSAGEVIEAYKYIGVATNNVAEYKALSFALEILEKRDECKSKLVVYVDSLLVCKQVNKQWACRALHLQPLLVACSAKFDEFHEWTIAHIKRNLNKQADKLANRAVDSKKMLVKLYHKE
jgi:ribonuclease HI